MEISVPFCMLDLLHVSVAILAQVVTALVRNLLSRFVASVEPWIMPPRKKSKFTPKKKSKMCPWSVLRGRALRMQPAMLPVLLTR